MRSVALLASAVFLKQLGLGGIGDVVVANPAQACETDHAVTQRLVILTVGKFGRGGGEGRGCCAHHDPFLQVGSVDHGSGTSCDVLVHDDGIFGIADIDEAAIRRQQPLLRSRPHRHQWFAAGNRRARDMANHLHVVHVRFLVEKIERAQRQAEWRRAATGCEPGHLGPRADRAGETGCRCAEKRPTVEYAWFHTIPLTSLRPTLSRALAPGRHR